MTWQIASLALLAVTLIAGAVAYERSRPASQLVALVAALAALAIAGRIVFSPIPNVVPSTDIVLIAGYALGGAPGFMVGALTGLVSNFWLGQGPWTPWQMAGWGLTGVFGALLAIASRRGLGRVQLALACGVAGFAYGALLDFSLMATYGGEQSLDRFLALSARGLPFNIAHAVGNFTLAMVAGPALVRMLSRYRSRFEFAWRGGGGSPGVRRTRRAAAGAACVLVAAVAAGAVAGPARTEAKPQRPQARAAASAAQALEWLKRAQNDDGGFGTGPGEPSSPQMTGWAALGIEAAGVNPLDVRKGRRSAIAYLRSTAKEISTTGDIERTILVLEAAGLDARRFAGRDLVSRLLARRGGSGAWGGQVNGTAFGILALDAAGTRSGNGRSAAWLRRNQGADGGWGFAPGAASDADSTGAALQALAAAGGSAKSIARGAAWLRGAQSQGGGFNLQGGPVNSQSTAWAVQGFVAAGVSPQKVRTGGRSAFDYLASIQAGDGHYRYSRAYDQTPVWVTGQALQAASSQAFPLRVTRSASGGGPGRGAGAQGGGAPPSAQPPPPPPAPGPPAAKGAGKPPAAPPAPGGETEPEPIPEYEPPPEEPASAAAEDGSDDGGGPDGAKIGSVALVLLVFGGGAWLLRRQDVGL